MPSAEGPQGPRTHRPEKPPPSQRLELQLVESLILHLVEKGVLTRNDALSVVQTVAEVKHGLREAGRPAPSVEKDLATLGRLYSSLELLVDRPLHPPGADDGNVLQLRPPLHGDNPNFPKNS